MKEETKTPRTSDDHKFPFSLLSTHKHEKNGLQITRLGDVSEYMDKFIGRPVFRIKGAISANNYLEIDHIQLVGSYVYIQFCLMSPVIATFHMEVITTANVSLRLSFSTMYDGEQPRFLGRSLSEPTRLPLPKLTGWMVLLLDLNQIIDRYCKNVSVNATTLGLQSIKKLQLCSNMVLRDVVTSDRLYTDDPAFLPKELSVRPGGTPDAVSVRWVDLLSYCQTSSGPAATPAHITPSHSSDATSTKTSRLQRNMHLLKSSPQNKTSACPLIASALRRSVAPPGVADKPKSHSHQSLLFTQPLGEPVSNNLLEVTPDRRTGALLTTDDLAAPGSHESHSAPVSLNSDVYLAQTTNADSLPDTRRKSTRSLVNLEVFSSDASTRRAQPVVLTTPRRGVSRGVATDSIRSKNHVEGASPGSSGGILRHFIPDTSPADRLLSMERLLGYSGGPSVLLYDGRMLVLSTGPLLVLVDLDKQAGHSPANGLWKAFKLRNASPGEDTRACDGYSQSVLRGHCAPIGLIEISDKETLMATAEIASSSSIPSGASPRNNGLSAARGPLLILWDLTEGRRSVSLRPHAESIVSVAFSPDCAMLVTAGTDAQFRHQVIVWDLQQLLLVKTVIVGYNNSSTALVIARQISEFHINSIRFSPFEDFSLVSCGRENIRFWRIRKGHLPGRPVLLNEYSRGFVFGQMAFNLDFVPLPLSADASSSSAVAVKRSTVYVSSNKGMLLRVDCTTTQVLCAFQLHSSPIRSLCIRFGYAVTGGDDHMLRVWPLDFSDFLLEAQHEGPVTSIRVSTDGRSQAIGTAAGTLGILNVSDHSYNTVLRSHVGSISRAASRGANWFEFATLGQVDHTVRVWDALSATQVIEFACEQDEPTALCYHPSEHLMACGFASGFMRLFDVASTAEICARKSHAASISALSYLSPLEGVLLLLSAGLDGALVVYSVSDNYAVVRTIAAVQNVSSTPLLSLRMAVSANHALVALSSSAVASIVVLETQEFTVTTRLSPIHQSGSSPLPGLENSPQNGHSTTSPLMNAPLAAALHSGSSHFAATNIFSVSGGGGLGGEGGGSVNASIVGMFFRVTPSDGATYLMVVTDKHIIALSVASGARGPRGRLVTKSQKQGAWESRSSRRIDFGRPTCVIVDPVSNMLFMAVHAPVAPTKRTSGPQLTDRLDETANSFVVLDVQLQASTLGSRGLSVSTVQLYRDLPSAVRDILPCLQCGRVVTVDAAGGIVLWEVRGENLDKFPHTLSLIGSRAEPSTLFMGNEEEEEEEEEEEKDHIPCENEDSPTPTGDQTPLQTSLDDKSQQQVSHCHLSSLSATTLTRDFELAARHDPAMWSDASTAVAISDSDARDESTRFASLYYDWEEATPGPGSSAQKTSTQASAVEAVDSTEKATSTDWDDRSMIDETASVFESTSLSDEPLLVPKKSITEAQIHHRKVEQGSKPALSTSTASLDRVDPVVRVLESPTGELQEWRSLFAPQHEPLPVVPGESAVEVVAVCHRHAAPPSVNFERGILLASDGTSMFVTHFGSSAQQQQLVLRVPPYLSQFEHCTVVCCALSPAGDCIAAVARVVSKRSLAVSAALCLLVWRLEESSLDSTWSLAGLAELDESSEHVQRPSARGHSHVLLDWAADGDLVVAVSVSSAFHSSRREEDSLCFSVVPRSAIGAGLIQEAVLESRCNAACPVSSGISHFKILPRASGVQRLSLMVTALSKLLYVTLSTEGGDGKFVARVLWSEDVGSRGPFLGMDVATGGSSVLSGAATAARKHSAQEVSRRVVALLDSCGSVRFVEVFWADDLLVAPPLPPRVVSVSIAAANASGALQSLTVSHPAHSQMQMVLGAAHTIRIFSVQIRDLGARSIAAQVTLIAKVSSDFRADFCFFARQPRDKTRGPSLRLVVASSDGQLGFTRVSALPSDKAALQFVSVRSALPLEALAHRAVVDLLVTADSRSVVLADSRGHLSCFDCVYGLKERGGPEVSWRASGLCHSFGSLLAAATRCGKVVLLDGPALSPLQVVDLAPPSIASVVVAPSVSSSVGSWMGDGVRHRLHHLSSAGVPEVAVTSIASLVGGSALLLAQQSGELSLVQLYPGQIHPPVAAKILPVFELSGPFAAPDSLRNDEQIATIVASCEGDEQMCGAVRKGSNVLELHRTDHNENVAGHAVGFSFAADTTSRRKSYWNNVMNLSLKTDAGGDLRISACHLVFKDRSLRICVVGCEEAAGPPVLFCGSLHIPSGPPLNSDSGATSPVRVLLTRLLRGVPLRGLIAHHFLGELVAVAHSHTVDVWNWAGEAIGEDGEARMVFSAPLAQFTFGSSDEWEGSVVCLSRHKASDCTKLFVYRNRNPALLTFNL